MECGLQSSKKFDLVILEDRGNQESKYFSSFSHDRGLIHVYNAELTDCESGLVRIQGKAKFQEFLGFDSEEFELRERQTSGLEKLVRKIFGLSTTKLEKTFIYWRWTTADIDCYFPQSVIYKAIITEKEGKDES